MASSTSMLLFEHMLLHRRQRGIPAASTMRSNRTKKAPLKTEKQLKTEGRGSYDTAMSEDGILLCSWFDNKQVSSFFLLLLPILVLLFLALILDFLIVVLPPPMLSPFPPGPPLCPPNPHSTSFFPYPQLSSSYVHFLMEMLTSL